jgi:VanZ like family
VVIHVLDITRISYAGRHEDTRIYRVPGALGILAARGARWAYITFVVAGILYFPASVGFHLHPHPCEDLPNLALAIYSLGNWPHMVLFVSFFIMTSAQFNMSGWSGFVWAAAACLVMGILVELAQRVSGAHHCRTRDLIPDTAGIMIGAAIVFLWNRLRTKPLTA